MKSYDKENPSVLHCDNHVLVAFKPAGMVTQASSEHSELGLDTFVKAWIKEKFQKPGKVFLEPIHRLDKPVSGLVLFARTSKALSRLQEQMRKRQIKKTYQAHVEGSLTEQEGRLEHYLLHESHKARVVDAGLEGAKLAILEYRVLSSNGRTTVLEIDLHTGRYHQIRAQCAHMGHPILGDVKYGSHLPYHQEGIALQHVKLSFIHPVSQEPISLNLFSFVES